MIFDFDYDKIDPIPKIKNKKSTSFRLYEPMTLDVYDTYRKIIDQLIDRALELQSKVFGGLYDRKSLFIADFWDTINMCFKESHDDLVICKT